MTTHIIGAEPVGALFTGMINQQKHHRLAQKNRPQNEGVGSKTATAWRLAGLADQSSDAVVLRAGNSINIALYGFPQATSGRRPAEWNPG
jgi:hypothetical protein